MFDEMGRDIDAVMVATPDHTHAVIAATAMTLGKHVYVQKPLAHSIYESRLLTRLASEYKVATQMGNQGASGDDADLVCEWIWNGEIGEVTKVEVATNRPVWPQGLETPAKAHKIPATLDWDLFIGPARMRPFNKIYHPWNWRGWWDFGTGALGDMGCHVLHPAFRALKLGYPVSVEATSSPLFIDCAPQSEYVKFVYPARKGMPKVDFPEVYAPTSGRVSTGTSAHGDSRWIDDFSWHERHFALRFLWPSAVAVVRACAGCPPNNPPYRSCDGWRS